MSGKTHEQFLREKADELKIICCYLQDHRWKKMSEVVKLCDQLHVSFSSVAQELQLAESDHGRWVCWPNLDLTPTFPPDEVRETLGLPVYGKSLSPVA